MPALPSYRNQAIDLLCKSIDWFLHEGNTSIKWIKLPATFNNSLAPALNQINTKLRVKFDGSCLKQE